MINRVIVGVLDLAKVLIVVDLAIHSSCKSNNISINYSVINYAAKTVNKEHKGSCFEFTLHYTLAQYSQHYSDYITRLSGEAAFQAKDGNGLNINEDNVREFYKYSMLYDERFSRRIGKGKSNDIKKIEVKENLIKATEQFKAHIISKYQLSAKVISSDIESIHNELKENKGVILITEWRNPMPHDHVTRIKTPDLSDEPLQLHATSIRVVGYSSIFELIYGLCSGNTKYEYFEPNDKPVGLYDKNIEPLIDNYIIPEQKKLLWHLEHQEIYPIAISLGSVAPHATTDDLVYYSSF